MSNLQNQIIEVIQENTGGIKAAQIAKILGVEKTQVNSCLYGKLKTKCFQTSDYKWHLKDTNISIKKTKQENVPTIEHDKSLINLCNYYLNCLSLEDAGSVRVFQSSQFDPDYVELKSLDDANDNSAAQELIKHVARSKKNLQTYIGYPVMVQNRISNRTGGKYRFVMPVFLFPTEIEGGSLSRSMLPSVNIEAIRAYSSNEGDNDIQLLVDLENELGLNEQDADIEIDELAARLQSIRDWEWKEKLDPDHICFDPPLTSIKDDGVYNRVGLFAVERAPYTQGLESELSKLSEIDANSYKETALYKWIHPETIRHDVDENSDNMLLHVLPLNSEQEDAINLGMNRDIAVITGPPGTGKSQVVTDFIVNAAFHNKNVLFASKNNKAVDVVYARVNSLASKPIMIRIGGTQYAHTLAELIQGLLSSRTDLNDAEDYKYYLNQYNLQLDRFEKLKKSKNEVLVLRNQLDHLSQKADDYRNEWGKCFDSVTDDDFDEFQKRKTQYLACKNDATKSSQSFIKKLTWFAIQKKREEAYIQCQKDMNQLLNDKFKQNQNLCSENDTEYLSNCESAIGCITEYRDAYNELLNHESLESLDKQLDEVEDNLSEIATELWDKFLITKPIDISEKDRNSMSEYVSAMRLIDQDVDLAGYPELQKEFKQLIKKMTKFLPCWAVTSLSAKGRIPFEPGTFDYLLIDEASQCDIASVLPLLYRAKKAIIIGDPNQLSHITGVSKKQDLALLQKFNVGFNWDYSENSLYYYASCIVKPDEIIQLRDHHRSHADIIEFSNHEFYDNKLRVATDYKKLKVPSNQEPGVRWIDVKGKTVRPASGSAINDHEAKEIVAQLTRFANIKEYKGTIGVVTPFKAQAEHIRQLVEKDQQLERDLYENHELVIDTVHKFQGDEKDIMIFSPVIAYGAQNSAISFLSHQGNIFNVAITRARSILIVVGNMEYCATCGVTYLQDFVKYIQVLNTHEQIHEDTYLAPSGREYPPVSNEEQVSDYEKILYTALYDAGIKTYPQYPIDKYKLDLALIVGNRKLDIEVDGERYHKDWSGELMYRDRLRNKRLFELDWDVKRFWVYEIIDNLPQCVSEISKWAKQ